MDANYRVVHVDSDRAFLDRSTSSLEAAHEGIEVVGTTDPDDALERVAAGSVDCLVTAFETSGTDGLTLIRDVRATHPDLPCLLFTDSDSGTAAAEALDVEVSAFLRKGESDQFARLAAHVVDAVDDHRTAAERDWTRRRFATLVGASPDLTAVVEPDGRFAYVSAAAERLLGHRPSDLVDEDALAYVHPDDRERAEAWLGRLVDRSDEGHADELRFRHVDGTWVWFELRGRTLLDDPAVDGLAVYARDVTARRRREEILRRYEAIVENMDDVVYTVDGSLTVTSANDRALAYAELSREEIVGQSIETLSDAMLGDPADVRRLRDTLEAVVAGESDGERLDLEIEVPRGTVFAELQVTPLRRTDVLGAADGVDADDADSPPEAVVVSRDVTGRVAQKRELERQNERLDAFASIVSHDLRSPLAVAQGNLELARGECDSDRLDAVEKAHERMTELVDGLLTVARTGTRVESPDRVDLDAVARSSWSFVAAAATVEIDTGLVIRADEQRLRQFLENLFRNSVEHGSTDSDDDTAEAGVTIRVGALGDDAGFYVEDDGQGIPPDERDHVFEAGYSTKQGGTGLGLVILREIAEAHGWELTITEGSAGGARFEVRGVTVERG
jgi:PAS domain S-box-containing protein